MESVAETAIALLLRALRDDNLNSDADLTAAMERLRNGGEQAADSLASLISALLDSRSPRAWTAIAAAKSCVMTAALKRALTAVAEAPELRAGHPGATRFTPEIFGDGKIGWTSATAARTRALAEQVLGVAPPPLPVSADTSPDMAKLVTQVRNFVAGREHATTLTETGVRVGAEAAPALTQLIEQNRSGPMALAIVYAVRKWEPADALPFIRHALGTGYPGAEYYAGIYASSHPTPEIKAMAREYLPKVRDADARRSLGDLTAN